MLAKKQCRGSGMVIPDPESQILIFFHPVSRIQQQQKFYKIVNYLNVLTGADKNKNGYEALRTMGWIRDPENLSRIRIQG
jgi:hypothetical protein